MIGDADDKDKKVEETLSVMLADIRDNSFSGNRPDAGAEFLDCCYQGIHENRHPQQTEAELRSRLRISGYSTRVQVCGAGYKARTWPA